jgi:hypothetical protein
MKKRLVLFSLMIFVLATSVVFSEEPPSTKDILLNDVMYITVSRGSYTDETILRLLQGATFAYDPSYDAYKVLTSNDSIPQVYTLLTTQEKMSINTLPEPLTAATAVPLGVKTLGSGSHQFSANITNFNPDIQILLEDLHLNVVQDLRTQPTYSFTPLQAEHNTRFLIHLNPVISNTNELQSNTVDVYSYGSSLYVSNVPESGLNLIVYTISGQQVFAKQLYGYGLQKASPELPQGLYIIKVIGEKNQAINTKMLFLN